MNVRMITEYATIRDYKREYDALAHALVGNTGLSAITEASKHAAMRAAMVALKSFPLPSQGATSVENYRRILSWLHGKLDVAALIIDLEFGAKETIDE